MLFEQVLRRGNEANWGQKRETILKRITWNSLDKHRNELQKQECGAVKQGKKSRLWQQLFFFFFCFQASRWKHTPCQVKKKKSPKETELEIK